MEPMTAMALASLVNTGANIWSTGQANRQAGVNSEEANDVSLTMQHRANEFSREMSNTAMQRKKADSIAAGINPVLSMTDGSGASTPSGASGSGQKAETFKADIDPMTAMQIAKGFEKTDAEIKNINAGTAKTEAETKIISPKATIYGEGNEQLIPFIADFKNKSNMTAQDKANNPNYEKRYSPALGKEIWMYKQKKKAS